MVAKIEHKPYTHQSYPKYKYHKEHGELLIQNEEDEALLDESWADSPAAHGIITAPSADQIMKDRMGFNLDDLRAKKKAEKAEREQRLNKIAAASEGEETSGEETSGESEGQEISENRNRKRR